MKACRCSRGDSITTIRLRLIKALITLSYVLVNKLTLSTSFITSFHHAQPYHNTHSNQLIPCFLAAEPASSESDTQQYPLYNNFAIDLTNITRHIPYANSHKPIPHQTEIALLRSGVLVQRGEFNHLLGHRVEQIEKQCRALGDTITLTQALLMRKQVLVTKTVNTSRSLLRKHGDRLEHLFTRRRKTLLQLSYDVDLPPVTIFRYILRRRIDRAYPDMLERDRKRLVKSIISSCDESYLRTWECEQLQEAKQWDTIAYAADPTELRSAEWESALYTYLSHNGVPYLSEEDLRNAGVSCATPDCLLLDDCYINGHCVRWIDSKMFYASGLKECWHYVNKLKKQVKKYNEFFGEGGAVIYRYGFSQRLVEEIPGTLFLDGGPLVGEDEMEE